MNFINLLKSFIFGGFVVVSVAYLSENINNEIAALLWAFPFTLFPILYYFHIQNTGYKHIMEFLNKTIYSVILLTITVLIIVYIYKYTHSILYSLLFSTIFYLFICYCIINIFI